MTDNDTLDTPTSLMSKVTGALLSLVALFFFGFAAGVTAATVEHGLRWKSFLLIPLAIVIGLWVARRAIALLGIGKWKGLSDYEVRYQKMWLVVLGLGIPLGILFWSSSGSMIRGDGLMARLAPWQGLGMTALFATMIVIGGVHYHRTIDDHEEKASLWSMLFAYYFLIIATVSWYLLQRASLVPDLDIGIALLGVLGSMVVQAAAWAWIKYR